MRMTTTRPKSRKTAEGQQRVFNTARTEKQPKANNGSSTQREQKNSRRPTTGLQHSENRKTTEGQQRVFKTARTEKQPKANYRSSTQREQKNSRRPTTGLQHSEKIPHPEAAPK